MSHENLVSIIIVTYNGRHYLQDCIHSLLQQAYCTFEIILVDNGSNDGSGAFVADHFPEVRLVYNQENNGFASACNQGAGLAQGEFLVFLNQDTRVCPGCLESLLAPFGAEPSIGLVTAKLFMMAEPDKINMCGQDIHFSGLAFARGFMQPAAGWTRAEIIPAVSGAAFAIRRELWQHLGGFDELLYMYYEETDLSWRAWRAGFSSYYAPQAMAYHDGRLRPSPNSIYYSARNRWVLVCKHWRTVTLFILLPGLLLAELIEWGAMGLYGRRGVFAKLRATGWLLGHLPTLYIARRAAQSTRKKPDWFLLEHVTPRLTPSVLTGGVIGKSIVAFLNSLLWLNYKAAYLFLRLFNL